MRLAHRLYRIFAREDDVGHEGDLVPFYVICLVVILQESHAKHHARPICVVAKSQILPGYWLEKGLKRHIINGIVDLHTERSELDRSYIFSFYSAQPSVIEDFAANISVGLQNLIAHNCIQICPVDLRHRNETSSCVSQSKKFRGCERLVIETYCIEPELPVEAATDAMGYKTIASRVINAFTRLTVTP